MCIYAYVGARRTQVASGLFIASVRVLRRKLGLFRLIV